MKTLAREPDAVEVLERLRQLRPDSPRQWGKMSPHQVVCHLSDGFRMASGQKLPSPATGLLQRTLTKWIALYLPLRWPVGIQTRPEIDQLAGGTAPRGFAEDVAELEALMKGMTARSPDFEWPAHPIFGPLSRSAWLRWGYLHMDHHLRQFGL